MSKLIECTLNIGDSLCHISCAEGAEPSYRQSRDAELSSREFSAVNAILETIRCLSLGRDLDCHFNPTVPHEAQDEVLMKLRWGRTGKLIILENETAKRWVHASNAAEALVRKRTFTCTRKVYHELPNRRSASAVSAANKKEKE